MTQQEKQAALDKAKWILSEEKGRDCCGEFEYCVKCDKSISEPCAIASNLYNLRNTEAVSAKPAPTKTTAKNKNAIPLNAPKATSSKPSAPTITRASTKKPSVKK